MLRIINILLILGILAGTFACGYDYDWMKGDFEGSTKLMRLGPYSKSSEVIRSGNGRINFAAPFYVRFENNTPLPDCNLRFSSEKEPFKYSLAYPITPYRGESNDGRGCGAYLIEGEAVGIDVNTGSMSRDKDGEVVMNIKFSLRGDSSRQYELEFRGRKKGWLW